MDNSEIIISGPEFTAPEFWGSIAEYLVPKMKSHPKDFVFQVECATNESITCEEFLRQSLEVAEGLVKRGVKEGDVVALMTPNSIRTSVTALGVLFSGGTLVTFYDSMKSVELQHHLNQSRPKFVFCLMEKGEDVRAASEAANLDPTIVLLDAKDPVSGFSKWEEFRAEVDLGSYVPRKVAHPKESIAFICFSSGTTGWPKGVALSHYAIVHNFVLTESLQNPAKNENFIFTSSLQWITGFLLLTHACNFGRTQYIPKSMDPEDFLEAVQNCKPFFFLLPPNVLLSLVRCPNFQKYDTSSVKIIFSGGASLGQEVLDEIKRTWRDVLVCNMYGSTETCGGIIQSHALVSSTALGKLVPGISVKVVDPSTGKSLGPHKVGEIRVKGRRLMNGYYNNEESTKASFDENGWLCMGDLVYYDEDQVFHFVGRIKETIQYLNVKISPVELESFLSCLPGIKDVAVVPVPHEMGGSLVRALVVKQENFEISAEEIIQAVKDNFIKYKHLSGGVQFVDSLPRTAVGKLKRLEAQKMVVMSET